MKEAAVVPIAASLLSVAPVVRTTAPPNRAAPEAIATLAPPAPVAKLVHRWGLTNHSKSSKNPNRRRSRMRWGRSRSFMDGGSCEEKDFGIGNWELGFVSS